MANMAATAMGAAGIEKPAQRPMVVTSKGRGRAKTS